ncbi:AAA family ATPase, partial [Butyricimonas faecihominis]
LSTMEAYFLGKRDLFKGLAIEQLETEWNTHAVLHLDLNAEKYDSPERLHDMLEFQLRGWEETYGTGGKGITHSARFMEVIQKAYEKTGRGVVILIDEYDKPLLYSFHDEALQKAFR